MITAKTWSLFGFVAFAFLPISAAEELSIQPKVVNIFQLPSVKSAVVCEGGGYFPILGTVDNRILAVIRVGGGHLGAGGALSLVGSDLKGEKWSAPQTIVDSACDDRNPAFAILPSKRMVLAYHEQASYDANGKYDPNLRKALCKVTWSDDLGKTWQPSKPLGVEGLESTSPYGRIAQLADGSLFLNVYGEFSSKVPSLKNQNSAKGDYAYGVFSKDNGETWGNPLAVMAQHNETAFLSLPNNSLLAVGRSDNPMQRMDYALSSDRGRSWSSPLRITGAMQHPGDLLILANGWILLVYGDRGSEEETIQGVVSRDWGKTWDLSKRIVFSRPARGDFGYPSATRLPNGNLALIYYWAGAARDAYDGSRTQAIFVQCKESELIDAYQQLDENK